MNLISHKPTGQRRNISDRRPLKIARIYFFNFTHLSKQCRKFQNNLQWMRLEVKPRQVTKIKRIWAGCKKFYMELQETGGFFLRRKLGNWFVQTACTNFIRQSNTFLLTCVDTHVRYVGFCGSHSFVRCVLRYWSPDRVKLKVNFTL
jgi:hypothetical protein